jgi:hypothetical protein
VTDWTGTSLEGVGPRCARCGELLVRPCGDPCLRGVDDPEVAGSCCGHRVAARAAVWFVDASRPPLAGEEALDYLALHGGTTPRGEITERFRNSL